MDSFIIKPINPFQMNRDVLWTKQPNRPQTKSRPNKHYTNTRNDVTF